MKKRTKNITVTLPEDTARWVRVKAAQEDISVSRFLSRMLQEQMESETNYRQAMQAFLDREPKPLKRPGQSYPTREQVHER